MSGVIQFVCEDRLDDFERHEQCFKSTIFDQDLEECRTNFEQIACQDRENALIACSSAAITASPSCDQGARDLLADFIREVFKYAPDCEVPGMHMLQKLHKKLFK